MKNLALAFCSLRPANLDIKTNNLRELEYLCCLEQLYRVIPKNFDILICENTIDNEEDIRNDDLRLFLQKNNTFFTGSVYNNFSNIGWGELLMLYNSLKKFPTSRYKFISYITARRIFTCPYVFEKTNTLKKNALISNPDFLYLDGKYLKKTGGLYNDMFFSMKRKFMIKYAHFAYEIIQKKKSFISYNLIRKKPAGSEQILFEFIKKTKVSYEYLDWLGLVRCQTNDGKNNSKNFHIC